MIYDIILVILGLLIVFEYGYIFITEREHSNRIQDVRDYYHDLKDKQFDLDITVKYLKDDLKRTDQHVSNLYAALEELHDALNEQGIATTFKTEEVKTLVKPEKTEDENELGRKRNRISMQERES